LAGSYHITGDELSLLGESYEASDLETADLRRWATELANTELGGDIRLAAGKRLIRLIPALLASPRDPLESRHGILVELLRQCRDAFPRSLDEPLAEVTRAAAGVLHALHRELHQMYKLDDNARAAVAIHRQNNPAANHAAQSIVIYPLNRAGAPGVAEQTSRASDRASGGGQ
jgi:hypothetical protein